MQETDAILLAAAKDEISRGRINDAFEQILLRYEKLIYHIARKYFSNAEDAMDASQEAAIKIFNGLPRVILPESGNLKAWICTVTARVCLDALRKRRVQTTELTEELHSTMSLPSAEETAAANERINEIQQAINKLPNDQRMVIILRDMQGLSYDEIATALKINVGTVKSRLARARDKLKKLL